MNTTSPKCLYVQVDEYTVVKFTQDSKTTYSTGNEELKDVEFSLCDEANKNAEWFLEPFGFSAYLYDTDGFEWCVYTDPAMLLSTFRPRMRSTAKQTRGKP